MADQATIERDRARARARARARKARQLAMQPTRGSMGEGLIDAYTQGAVLGFGDEITAHESALLGRQPGGGTFDLFDYGDTTYSQRHEAALGAERAQQQEFRKAHPYTAFGAELAGGLTSGLAAGPVMGVAVPARMATAAAQIPGWQRAAALGGTMGGIYGAGVGEGGVEPRLESAMEGAKFGAALGPVGYGAGRLLQAGGRGVKQLFQRRQQPERAATSTLRQAFANDEITIARARAKLREGGRQATLADVGGTNVRGVVKGTYGLSTPARSRIEKTFGGRAESEKGRVTSAIHRAFGGKQKNFYAEQDQFIANMKEKAAPLYQQAYEKNPGIPMTKPLKRLLGNRTMQRALRETADIVSNERAAGAAKYLGPIDDELTEMMRVAREMGIRPPTTPAIPARPGVMRNFSLETWDSVKKGLDSLIEAQRKEVAPNVFKLTNKGRTLVELKSTLVRELGKTDKSGLYARARATFAGEAEALDALEAGLKAVGQPPELITRALGKLSDTGQDAYRTGFVRGLLNVATKTGDTSTAARRIFASPERRARLKAILPDKKDYEAFAREMANEIMFTKTGQEVMAGSPTAYRLGQMSEMQKAAERGGAMAAVSATGLGTPGIAVAGAQASIFRKIVRGIIGKDHPDYYKTLAKMTASRNQAQNQLVLDHLAQLPEPEAVGRLAKVLTIMGGVAEPVVR